MCTFVKRLALGLIILAVTVNVESSAWADDLPQEPLTPLNIPTRQTLAERAAAIKDKSAATIKKIKDNKMAWESGKKARNTYLMGAAMLLVKEVARRLSAENLDLNEENASKKIVEIEKESPIWQQSTYQGVDGALLALPTWMLEWNLAKKFPFMFNSNTFRGKFFNSFVVGFVLADVTDVIDRLIIMSADYVIRHPEMEFISGHRGYSADEAKELTLLQQRAGLTYFGYHCLGGGNKAESGACHKTFFALLNILTRFDNLSWTFTTDIVENTLLNGQNLTTLLATSLGGAATYKIIPDTARLKLPKRMAIGVAVAGLVATAVDQKYFDRMTASLKEMATSFDQGRLQNIYEVKSVADLQKLFYHAKKDRENLAHRYFYIVKMATDKMQEAVVQQNDVVLKLNELDQMEDPKTGAKIKGDQTSKWRWMLLQSSSLRERLNKLKKDNEDTVIYYQSLIKEAMDQLLANYNQDLYVLQTYSEKPRILSEHKPQANLAAAEAENLMSIRGRFEKMRADILYEYNPQDLTLPYSEAAFGAARLGLNTMALWGVSEDLVANWGGSEALKPIQ